MTGRSEGRVWEMIPPELTFGRSRINNVCTLHDPETSRHHARATYENDNWQLINTSRNGTFVNDTRICDDGRVLSPRDIITMGSTQFIVLNAWHTQDRVERAATQSD